eukprot:750666-Hanusia_phi.AAC.1
MKFWALKMTQYSKILFVDADSVFYKDPSPLFLQLQHFTGCQANGIKAWVGAARCLNGALLFFQPSEELYRRHVQQQQVISSTCRHTWMDVTEMGPLNAQNPSWRRPHPAKLDAGLCFDPYAYSVRLPPLYTDFNLEEDMILMHGMKYTNLDELAEEKWFVGHGMRSKVLLPFRAEFERKDELWKAPSEAAAALSRRTDRTGQALRARRGPAPGGPAAAELPELPGSDSTRPPSTVTAALNAAAGPGFRAARFRRKMARDRTVTRSRWRPPCVKRLRACRAAVSQ